MLEEFWDLVKCPGEKDNRSIMRIVFEKIFGDVKMIVYNTQKVICRLTH